MGVETSDPLILFVPDPDSSLPNADVADYKSPQGIEIDRRLLQSSFDTALDASALVSGGQRNFRLPPEHTLMHTQILSYLGEAHSLLAS